MEATQLKLNIDNESDVRFLVMQNQIDAIHESLGKTRRRLFSEIGEMKKHIIFLKGENEDLKNKLKGINNEKTEWIYSPQNGSLFNVREIEKRAI